VVDPISIYRPADEMTSGTAIASTFGLRKRVSVTLNSQFVSVVDHPHQLRCNFDTLVRVSTSLTIEFNVGLICQPNMRTIGRARWISMYPGG
jgi:hypothetical protein